MTKKSLVTSLLAVPLLSLSSLAFAAQAEEPLLLSAVQMDAVTAGNNTTPAPSPGLNFLNLGQINISPVTVVQISVLNFGFTFNVADLLSGNAAGLRR